jgi:hypothetical protein
MAQQTEEALHIVPTEATDLTTPSPKRAASERFAREQIQADPPLYTWRAATIYAARSEDTLRRKARAGELKLVRVQGRSFVDGESLRAMVRAELAGRAA